MVQFRSASAKYYTIKKLLIPYFLYLATYIVYNYWVRYSIIKWSDKY